MSFATLGAGNMRKGAVAMISIYITNVSPESLAVLILSSAVAVAFSALLKVLKERRSKK